MQLTSPNVYHRSAAFPPRGPAGCSWGAWSTRHVPRESFDAPSAQLYPPQCSGHETTCSIPSNVIHSGQTWDALHSCHVFHCFPTIFGPGLVRSCQLQIFLTPFVCFIRLRNRSRTSCLGVTSKWNQPGYIKGWHTMVTTCRRDAKVNAADRSGMTLVLMAFLGHPKERQNRRNMDIHSHHGPSWPQVNI